MTEKFHVNTFWEQGNGLICSIKGENGTMFKKISGLHFFTRVGQEVVQVAVEHNLTRLNGIRFDFEMGKSITTHRSLTAKKGETVFLLQERNFRYLCLEADAFGLSEATYRLDYNKGDVRNSDALFMERPIVYAVRTCPILRYAIEMPERDGWAGWAVIRDEYLDAAKALASIKRASDVDPIVKKMKLCLRRMDAIKTYWEGYSSSAYASKKTLIKKVSTMTSGERTKMLRQLTSTAETYLEAGRGSLVNDDIRAHIDAMWAYWTSFIDTKPNGMNGEWMEDLVVRLLESAG